MIDRDELEVYARLVGAEVTYNASTDLYVVVKPLPGNRRITVCVHPEDDISCAAYAISTLMDETNHG